MRRRWIRRVLWGSLIVAPLLVVAALVMPPFGREAQRRRVEAAIARFEAGPSQRGADKLAQLLARNTATKEQGERILKVLLYPAVVTRSAYPFDIDPTFTLARPFRVRFAEARISRYVGVWLDGKEQYSGSAGGSNGFDTTPHLYSLHPKQRKPGLYRVDVRHRYEGTVTTEKTSWTWNPLRGRLPWSLLPHRRGMLDTSVSPRYYACHFSVPVEFKLVERDHAEKVGLLADAETNTRMQREFAAGTPDMGGTYVTPAGKRGWTGAIEIKYSDLPVAVAFRSILRLANGEEIPRRDTSPEWRRARAGASGLFHVTPGEFLLEEPGDYKATVILTPDPNNAYRDPAIKAIWNGTLEFPIRFTVEAVAEPNASGPK